MPTCLITGANRGIGLEFVHQLSKDYDIIATARHPSNAGELLATGARVEALDVANESSVSDLAARLSGESIDLLINNAGVFTDRQDGFDSITSEQFETSFRVNAVGPLLVTRALLANIERGARKLVVNITSQMGSCKLATDGGAGGHFAYRSSKAALNMQTVLMAGALKDRGISVVGFHPGWVQTDMGGQNATLTTSESVGSMIAAFARIGIEQTGSYFDEQGNTLPF